MTVDSTMPAARQEGGKVRGARGAEPDPAGLLLARLSVLPALLVLPFLLTGFPLLLLGWFKPVPVLAAWLVLAAVVGPIGWRRVPAVNAAADLGTGDSSAPDAAPGQRTPWWSFAALTAVVLAFGIQQVAYHSQFIIVMLDPASYMQFAAWIAGHGSLPIPQHAGAFGGAPGITFGSAAFYQWGGVIVPQFMAGLPMLLSVGFWAGGVHLAVFLGPLLGAAAMLTFGGLAARLIGPRWAWLAALTLAVTVPQQYVSRATFSEPLAQILFLGGLSLWIDAQRTDRGAADAGAWRLNWRVHGRSATHALAALAGLLLGITLLVRLDGPSDILLTVPYCGFLLLRGRLQAAPLLAGMFVGLAYGAADGLLLSRPYLHTNISSVRPMTEAFAAVSALTWLAVLALRRRRRQGGRAGPHPGLVTAVTALPFLVVAAFLFRPMVQHDWKRLEYAPFSLYWVYWYIGAPAIVLGVVATAMLARRCLRGEAPTWVLPLLTFAWTTTEFLYRPAITPHQPWASRRLVPAVLPGLILLAVWLTAWLTRRARNFRLVGVPRHLERSPRVVVIACCLAGLVVPPAVAAFGIGLGDGPGFSLAANGLAVKTTNAGEIGAVDQLCAAIPAGSSVLIIDRTLMLQFGQVIRGMCGFPVARLPNPTPVAVAADVRAIQRTGRRPVVLARRRSELNILATGTVKKVMALNTTIDEHAIMGVPRDTIPQLFTIYSWEPAK